MRLHHCAFPEGEGIPFDSSSALIFKMLLLSNIVLKKFRFDDRPVLSDFGTDSIYRFCDVVQFVYRDTYAEQSTSSITQVEIITAKSVSQQANGTMITAGLPDYPIISPLADNTALD